MPRYGAEDLTVIYWGILWIVKDYNNSLVDLIGRFILDRKVVSEKTAMNYYVFSVKLAS